ncbi:MAG: nucleotide exchange factor GrpE [Thermodesulfovibrionales bacterium]
MNEYNTDTPSSGSGETEGSQAQEKAVIEELNNKYLRLYAEFDNYKKRVNRDKEELVKYGNESLIYELLPIIDSLELALKHAQEESQAGIVQGVEMTLKELQRTLEKFGISRIEAAGKEFDPSIHHAMTQVVREDIEEKMVAEELRAGYLYRDKVLRPSLVSVSVKPQKKSYKTEMEARTEVAEAPEAIKININENIKEDE